MNRKHLTIAIACALVAPAAWAQDASTTSTDPARGASATNLDTVVVTARKREETLQDVPVAVTAFTADTLDTLAVEDISDLDSEVPNLTIYAARGSSSTVTAYIRGIGQSDPLWGVDPGVGIYLDDVYIARPQGALLDVFDVQRIEVLRGPQGTLYGKNTIGGAIKYVSRGLSEETEGFGSITVGTNSQLDVKAGIGGSVGNGALRGRVAVASLNRDGYGENLVTDQQVSDKEILAARVELGAYVSEDFDIHVNMDWMDDQSGVRGAKMLAPNPFNTLLFPQYGAFPPLDDRYDVRNGMPNINDTSMKGISAAANWRINDDFSLKYVIAKRESDTETNIDFDLTTAPITDVKAFYSDEQVSNELQVNYDAGGRARGVMGLYWFDGEAGGQVLNNFLNASFGDTQGTVYTNSVALYADWTFDLTDRLHLDVGARYTDEEKRADVLNRAYSDATFTTPIATVSDFDKTINFKNTSPKVALNYDVTPDIMVYGSASRGFKSGGYNIRANAVAVPSSAEPFDDEVVDSYEIGSKMAFLDQSLFLNLAAFHNRYKDIQLSVFTAYDSNGDGVDDAFFGDFTNAGEGTVNGVEVEYQWLPTSNWSINGNLAWLDTGYDEFITSGVNVADDQKFTNAPEFSGAINVEYRIPLSNGGDIATRVGYSYQSEVYPTTDLSEAIKQDGYGLLSAGVIWNANEDLSFALQGKNLLDEEYRTTGYNIPVLGILTGFYGAPREISLSARYEF
ncbi:TonB-dependent receptor [Lysobacter sp. SG-8]|uniref:TonB-dependent receptor n=1 Tax=Marilutibacter penaei TaxID=2759900 RepID=A0A7W3U258_9GAMM|nr:TonB-dependent receptor [Lysobacter penaei]MBB1087514.1 TonB-dependent receptor [Lysobacter penaei]